MIVKYTNVNTIVNNISYITSYTFLSAIKPMEYKEGEEDDLPILTPSSSSSSSSSTSNPRATGYFGGSTKEGIRQTGQVSASQLRDSQRSQALMDSRSSYPTNYIPEIVPTQWAKKTEQSVYRPPEDVNIPFDPTVDYRKNYNPVGDALVQIVGRNRYNISQKNVLKAEPSAEDYFRRKKEWMYDTKERDADGKPIMKNRYTFKRYDLDNDPLTTDNFVIEDNKTKSIKSVDGYIYTPINARAERERLIDQAYYASHPTSKIRQREKVSDFAKPYLPVHKKSNFQLINEAILAVLKTANFKPNCKCTQLNINDGTRSFSLGTVGLANGFIVSNKLFIATTSKLTSYLYKLVIANILDNKGYKNQAESIKSINKNMDNNSDEVKELKDKVKKFMASKRMKDFILSELESGAMKIIYDNQNGVIADSGYFLAKATFDDIPLYTENENGNSFIHNTKVVYEPSPLNIAKAEREQTDIRIQKYKKEAEPFMYDRDDDYYDDVVPDTFDYDKTKFNDKEYKHLDTLRKEVPVRKDVYGPVSDSFRQRGERVLMGQEEEELRARARDEELREREKKKKTYN
jgi:hypothetical protein